MLKRLLVTTALTLVGLAPAAADTTLKLVEVITSPERTETLKEIVAGFEKANPGTHVEITSLPWGQAFEKFATMVSAGDTPDVMEMPDRWLALYVGSKRLENLEPYLAKWDNTKGLNDRALEMGRFVDKTAYMLPYGFYLRALFYNKVLFKQAGIETPPKTVDDFVADAKKIATIPGKSGYCLRGGPGGLNGWMMFGATMAGSDEFFKPDGTSTMSEPDWVKGSAVLVDLYKSGAAPKDSVNWGFNEIVSGFYSGTCAMLDQDPDALIAIAERMKPDEFGVTTMPKGPSGKAYPTIGYAGWSMFADSKNKDLSWKLIAALDGPEGNIAWNKRTGALPIYKAAETDPFYAGEQFKGWFNELADKDVHPLVMPTYLSGFAYFADSIAVKTSQQALLGQITPEQLNTQWADALTKAKKKDMAKK
ncbi:ABC transporter substrate-binding protein [Lichenifustis flavocetrariae]|uniref:Sugar ABC transporter substrate-binding protein n=1 Tax=Lichenifustis flavocetrariae TaxID=2949735 RepID=A0AA41Z1U4_9HYPH|nr:sugar ABC transporter substrate-binding protein [Lichenifustis flavocetrariae]MCW6508933.1 sugar ABC transporter substrate-binding protein [Lichenifustis flavocetrariae]